MCALGAAGLMVSLVTARQAQALDAPAHNPSADSAAFGSSFGWSAVGGGPPPGCWPTGAEPRRLGPLFPSDSVAREWAFETQVVRLDAFVATNAALDLTHIKAVARSCYDLPFLSIDNLRFGVD